jgi:hypothetical protein
MSKDQDHRKVATYILGTANKVVTTERGGQHGGAEDSFQMIGHFWSVYLTNTNSQRGVPGINITPKDVAQMMVLLKIARNVHGALKDDDFVDQAGYTALAAALNGIEVPTPVAPITPPGPIASHIPDASTVSLAKKFAPRPDPIPETKSVVVPPNADMSKVLDQLSKEIVE